MTPTAALSYKSDSCSLASSFNTPPGTLLRAPVRCTSWRYRCRGGHRFRLCLLRSSPSLVPPPLLLRWHALRCALTTRRKHASLLIPYTLRATSPTSSPPVAAPSQRAARCATVYYSRLTILVRILRILRIYIYFRITKLYSTICFKNKSLTGGPLGGAKLCAGGALLAR